MERRSVDEIIEKCKENEKDLSDKLIAQYEDLFPTDTPEGRLSALDLWSIMNEKNATEKEIQAIRDLAIHILEDRQIEVEVDGVKKMITL